MGKLLSVYESDSPRNEDWHILLCMNNENGDSTGLINTIEISTVDGDMANFSHVDYGVKGNYTTEYVRIGRRKFDITGYNSHVGNIFWNLVTVTPEIGEKIMKWIKKMKTFNCEGGTVRFLNKYGF